MTPIQLERLRALVFDARIGLWIGLEINGGSEANSSGNRMRRHALADPHEDTDQVIDDALYSMDEIPPDDEG